jgi:hypothetical protein
MRFALMTEPQQELRYDEVLALARALLGRIAAG